MNVEKVYDRTMVYLAALHAEGSSSIAVAKLIEDLRLSDPELETVLLLMRRAGVIREVPNENVTNIASINLTSEMRIWIEDRAKKKKRERYEKAATAVLSLIVGLIGGGFVVDQSSSSWVEHVSQRIDAGDHATNTQTVAGTLGGDKSFNADINLHQESQVEFTAALSKLEEAGKRIADSPFDEIGGCWKVSGRDFDSFLTAKKIVDGRTIDLNKFVARTEQALQKCRAQKRE